MDFSDHEVTLVRGDRERCLSLFRSLSLEKGAVHCFPEDEIDPELSAMDNIISVTASPNKGNILRAVRGTGLPVNRRAGELSFSDRRKIVLLRALFAEYELLLLFEPLNGIEDHLDEMRDYLSSMSEGRCVLVYSSVDTGITLYRDLVL